MLSACPVFLTSPSVAQNPVKQLFGVCSKLEVDLATCIRLEVCYKLIILLVF